MASLQEQINQQVAGLYIAFYNRAPDAEGLAYWYNVALSDGEDYIYQIAELFAQHPSFDDQYANMTDEEFVKAIYQNVLNDVDDDQAAIDYWVSQVEEMGRPAMVAKFVDTVLNYDGTDPDGLARQEYLMNKIDVGLAFAGTLGEDSNPQNPDNLDNDPAYQASIWIIQDVVDDQSKEAALDFIANHPTLSQWVNQNPEISPVDAVVLDEDTSTNGMVTATDVDNPYADQTLEFILSKDASNGTVTVNPDGTFSYVPYADFNGDDSFEVTVLDGEGGSDTATVYVTVNPVNDAPVAVDAAVTTDEDNSITSAIQATDVDGDTLIYSLDMAASHGSVTVNQDGSFVYTPDENFNGSDSFVILVDDGNGGTDTSVVSVTVNPVNDAPVADDIQVTTDEDNAVNGQVVASDVDGDTLSYTVSSGPANGTVTLNSADGTFTYTPNANYFGTDSFEVLVDDGNGGQATATISLTVEPVNDAPVADDGDLSTMQNVAVDGVATASDIDTPADQLTYTVTVAPSHGTVTMNQDGTFTYTPDTNWSGTDSFEFTVSDGELTDTGMIDIEVAHVDQRLTKDVDNIDLSLSTQPEEVVYGKNEELNTGDVIIGSDQTTIVKIDLDDSEGPMTGSNTFSGFTLENIDQFVVTNDRSGWWWATSTATFDLSDSDFVGELVDENSYNDVVFAYAKADANNQTVLTIKNLTTLPGATTPNVTLDVRDGDTGGTSDTIVVNMIDTNNAATDVNTVTLDSNVENIVVNTDGTTSSNYTVNNLLATGATSFVAEAESGADVDMTFNGMSFVSSTSTTVDFSARSGDVIAHVDTSATIYGGSGDDQLFGDGGGLNYVIYGNEGDDAITVNTGSDSVYGGSGDDKFYFNVVDNSLDVTDVVQGGDGDDTLYVGGYTAAHTGALDGVTTTETIVLTNVPTATDYNFYIGAWSAFATDTTRVLVDATAAQSVTFNAINLQNRGIDILASTGNDNFTGSNFNDTFDDQISGGGASDIFNGNDGDDIWLTTADNFNTSTGNDTYNGGNGYDSIEVYNDAAGANEDVVLGSQMSSVELLKVKDVDPGVDDGSVDVTFTAGYNQANMTVDGSEMESSEDLTVRAEYNAAGEDLVVHGGAGDDNIYLGMGNDTVNGNAGDDDIHFNGDNSLDVPDVIDGGDGTDRIFVNDTSIVDAQFTNVTNVEELWFENDATLRNYADYTITLADEAQEAGIRVVDFGWNKGKLNFDGTAYTENLTVLASLYNYSDNIQTGAGDDYINSRGADDIIMTNDGNDTIDHLAGTANTIDLGAGDDNIIVHHGGLDYGNEEINWTEVIDGNDGDDSFLIDIHNNTNATYEDYVDLDNVVNMENFTLLNEDSENDNAVDYVLHFRGGSATSVTPVNIDLSGFGNDVDDSATIVLESATSGGTTDVDADYAFTITGSATSDILVKQNVGVNNDIVFNGLAGDDTFQFDGGDLGSSISYDGGTNNLFYFDKSTWTAIGGDAVQLMDFNGAVDAVIDDDFTHTTNVEVLRAVGAGAEDVTIGSAAAAAGITVIDYSAMTDVSGDTATDATLNIDSGFSSDLEIYMGAGDETYDGVTLNYAGDMAVYSLAGNIDANDAVLGGSGTNVLNLTADNGAADLAGVTGFHIINVTADMDNDATSTYYGASVTLNTDAFADANNVLLVNALDLDNGNNWLTFDGTAETDGDIIVDSTMGNDIIMTGAGNDIISTYAGDDTIYGGDGDETIDAGAGNDVIGDTTALENGVDTIIAGEGADLVYGGRDGDNIDLSELVAAQDTLIYMDQLDSDGLHLDTITGFDVWGDGTSANYDVIDLSAITGGSGDYVGEVNTYADINAALTGTAGEAILTKDTSMLYVDVDGSGTINAGDIQIHLDGVVDMDETTDQNFIF